MSDSEWHRIYFRIEDDHPDWSRDEVWDATMQEVKAAQKKQDYQERHEDLEGQQAMMEFHDRIRERREGLA